MNRKMMKKVTFLSLIALMFVLSMSSVYAADFTCAALGGDVLIDTQLADIVHLIIKIIQIVVPILLIIFGMLDLAKAVMAQKEDEIKKGQQTFVKRLIAAIIVFFVIAVVKLVISAVAKGDDGIMACANCFIEGSDSASCTAASTTVTGSDAGFQDEG